MFSSVPSAGLGPKGLGFSQLEKKKFQLDDSKGASDFKLIYYLIYV